MQHTYRIAHQRPHLYWATYRVLSKSLERISKDLQICQNIPYQTTLHWSSYYTRPRKSASLSSSCPTSRVPPKSRLYFRLQWPSQGPEYRVHTTFFKNHFFGLLGPQNVKIRQNLNIDLFHDDNTFPIGKVKINSRVIGSCFLVIIPIGSYLNLHFQ